MKENPSVLRFRHGDLVWYAGTGAPPVSLEDPAEGERLHRELDQAEHRVVFAAPGDALRLLELQIQPEERRHLDAALPFLLEDTLSEDLEALHFARCELGRDRYGVAIVSREQMHEWQAVLGDFAHRLPWRPEPLLLPWSEGEWTLLVEAQSVLLRFGASEGARVERELLSMLLGSLEQERAPQRVVIYGLDEAADRSLIPAGIQERIEWRRGGLEAALLLGSGPTQGPDLLQGDFAPQLPYGRWWAQWRWVAAVFAAAVALHLTSGWLDYRRLERENLALRTEVQQVYRSVNPSGAIADVEKQLSRQLADLRGGDANGNFAALLEPIAIAVARNEGVVLANLSYNQRSGQLRVNLTAPSFAKVEALRNALISSGLSTTLENSSRSNERVTARLRIEAST